MPFRTIFSILFFCISLFSFVICDQRDSVVVTNPDSAVAALYTEGNYWKILETVKQYDVDTLSPKVNYFLGMAYAVLNDYRQMQTYFTKAIARDSTNIQYRYQYGRVLGQFGMYSDAIAVLTACTQIDSTFLPAFFQLGLTYAAVKDNPNAEIHAFSYVVEKNPDDYASLFYIGEAYKRMQNTDSSRVYYHRSLAANTKYFPALVAVGNSEASNQKYAAALVSYKEADAVRPNNKDLVFQIGECYRKIGMDSVARWYYGKAIALDCSNALYHAQMAYAFFTDSLYASSAAEYNYAIALDSENVQYRLNLALVYKKLDSTNQVINTYRGVTNILHPEGIAAAYFLAYCFQEKANNKVAIEMYRRYLRLIENDSSQIPLARYVNDKIKELQRSSRQ